MRSLGGAGYKYPSSMQKSAFARSGVLYFHKKYLQGCGSSRGYMGEVCFLLSPGYILGFSQELVYGKKTEAHTL